MTYQDLEVGLRWRSGARTVTGADVVARLVTALVYELDPRPGAWLGLATMCIGVGQGIALAPETVAA